MTCSGRRVANKKQTDADCCCNSKGYSESGKPENNKRVTGSVRTAGLHRPLGARVVAADATASILPKRKANAIASGKGWAVRASSFFAFFCFAAFSFNHVAFAIATAASSPPLQARSRSDIMALTLQTFWEMSLRVLGSAAATGGLIFLVRPELGFWGAGLLCRTNYRLS